MSEFVGGFQDAVNQGASLFDPEAHEADIIAKQQAQVEQIAEQAPAKAAKKLSYKDQRELEQLPDRMESIETEIGEIESKMADNEFFMKPVTETQPVIDKLAQLNEELEQALERWEYLASFED